MNLTRITAIAEALDNADAVSCDAAIANLDAGTPAYWHTSSAATAAPAGLASSANLYASLTQALAEFGVDWFAARGGMAKFLDQLIPLNEAAIDELAAAYVRANTFRPAHELRARERRAVMGTWPAGRPKALVDWNVREAAQTRWAADYGRTAEAA